MTCTVAVGSGPDSTGPAIGNLEALGLGSLQRESTAHGQRFARVVQQTGPDGERTVVPDSDLVIGGDQGQSGHQSDEALHFWVIFSEC